MSKFKIVFIILLIATIIWAIAFHCTRQEYHKYIEWLESEGWWEQWDCPDEMKEKLKEMWGLREPWWMWNGMRYIFFAGFLLLLAWIGFIATAIGKLSERKKANADCVGGVSPPSPN